MKLTGKVLKINEIDEISKNAMYHLMAEHYENISWRNFQKDLKEKDFCIVLYDETKAIRGFSTQKILCLPLGETYVHGVFSGDTIIHKDYWGSTELFKIFTDFFIDFGEKYDAFYWFLISKGYKTYKLLPLFFNDFYPNYKKATPFYEQSIMNAFGKYKYPDEFNENSGVICYNGSKDRLKDGIADITERQLKDEDIRFFMKKNPHFMNGDDLVCLTNLKTDNFKTYAKKLLFGK